MLKMAILDQEGDDQFYERIGQYGKINEKLLAMILGAVFICLLARTVLMTHTSVFGI